MESTSLSLLQQARANSPEAWERLVRLYGPLVEYWCRKWGAQDADVEDIRQEVFQGAAIALPTFRRDRPGDTFRGWLRVIARRRFIDFCRRQKRAVEATGGSNAYLKLLEVPEAEDDPEDDDPPDQLKQLRRRAVELIRGHFKAKTWQAFCRCVIDERSPDVVATELDMTPFAVRQAKSRVLRRLRGEMGDLVDNPRLE